MDPEKATRKNWLFPAFVAALIVVLFMFVAPPADKHKSSRTSEVTQHSGLNLLGVIQTTNQEPIPEANIFIYTAGPRSGPGYT